jgi:hypothetical protein
LIAQVVAPSSAGYIGVSPLGVGKLMKACMSLISCWSPIAAAASVNLSAAAPLNGTSGSAQPPPPAGGQEGVSLQGPGLSCGQNRNATPSPADAGSWKKALSAFVAGIHRSLIVSSNDELRFRRIEVERSSATNRVTGLTCVVLAAAVQAGDPHSPD